MFLCIICRQNPPKLVIYITKIPTREQNFPKNGLLGTSPPSPPLDSALRNKTLSYLNFKRALNKIEKQPLFIDLIMQYSVAITLPQLPPVVAMRRLRRNQQNSLKTRFKVHKSFCCNVSRVDIRIPTTSSWPQMLQPS